MPTKTEEPSKQRPAQAQARQPGDVARTEVCESHVREVIGRFGRKLVDYSSTKGAVVAFTRSLTLSLAKQGVRVNAVAPGPVWTPLIPSTFLPEEVETFGSSVPLKRAAEPAEIASAYVFLASADSSYMTGQVLHPNGGEIING